MTTSLFVVIVNFKSKLIPIGVPTIIIDNNKINRGFAKAANLGIKQALKKGADKILLINPDIRITKANIKNLAQNESDIVSPFLKFKRHGKTILDYGGKVNWLLGRPTHNENNPGRIDLDPQRSEDRSRECDYVSFACVLIDKKVFQKIGFLDENFFMYFEDVDFCLRAKSADFKVAVDQNVVVDHQISEHKFSNNKLKMKYLSNSNKHFVKKWIPWYFKPLAYFYLFLLSLKMFKL